MSKRHTMWTLLAALLLFVPVVTAGPRQDSDPELLSVVQRFFAAQQAEDAGAYLALWSGSAKKPLAAQLQHVFDSGDDEFLDVRLVRATVVGETARVRATATRMRTDARAKNADGSPRTFRTTLQVALSLVREDGTWKIAREGAPADELAQALIDTADADVRQALMKAEPALLNARLVDAIARQADALAQQQKFRPAQTLYERSLEVAVAIGNRKLEGQALQNVANSLYFQASFPAARDTYERRLRLERDASNDEGIAGALLGIATVLYSTHEYGAALETYREALAIQERMGDLDSAATTLLSTGNVLYLQGDFEAAIDDYVRAEALERKHLDPAGAASALEGIGRVYSAQGDFAAALKAFAGVLDERRRMNDGPRQAFVLQSIGEIHFRLGNTDRARTSYLEARQLFEKFQDLSNAGRALQGAALTELVAGRFPAAEKAYSESIAACTTAVDHECVARAQVGLAYALTAQEKFDDAVTWYGRSLAAFGALKMEDAGARARIGLAEALSGRGDHDKALEQAITARRIAVGLDSDDILWRALVAVARAERKLLRAESALGSARAAVSAVSRMAAAAVNRPGQAAPRDTTAAFAMLAVLQAEAGDGRAAFTTAEMMRSHALRIALASSERDISRGMTDDERATERALATKLTTLLVQRDREKQLPKPDRARLDTLQSAIEAATARRNEAREKVFARLPNLRSWRALEPPASPADLPTLLDAPGKLLLQFVVDDHDLVILTAATAAAATQPEEAKGDAVTISAHVAPLARHTLAERIVKALDGAALSTVEGWRLASSELFAIFPESVRAQLSAATSITLLPDDVLWRVPFEAMPVKDRYLADSASVTYASSLAAAVRAPAAERASREMLPVLAVAAPVVPARVLEALKATAPTWTPRSSDASAGEVALLAGPPEKPNAVVITGADATKPALVTRAAASGPLHLAAPFRVNSASPLFSPVLLSEVVPEAAAEGVPARTGTDSELEAREVFNLELAAPVVMLSDPSALSMRNAAAGIMPVYWAWRSAGVTTFIVRRWGGNEGASNRIVAMFYERLRAGDAPAAALDAARAALRRTEGGRAPAAWAGWLVIDGR